MVSMCLGLCEPPPNKSWITSTSLGALACHLNLLHLHLLAVLPLTGDAIQGVAPASHCEQAGIGFSFPTTSNKTGVEEVAGLYILSGLWF